MARKEYVAKSIVTMSVPFGAGRKLVEFIQMSGEGSYYITDNEELQAAIENDYYFTRGIVKLGRVYKKEDSCNSANSNNSSYSDNSKVVLKRYEGVKRCSDAIAILRDEYGVTASINTKAKILDVAQEKGVCFPDL